jgi:hypothetical protein
LSHISGSGYFGERVFLPRQKRPLFYTSHHIWDDMYEPPCPAFSC